MTLRRALHQLGVGPHDPQLRRRRHRRSA
jgi:hypothetical protein